jgi:preprotein translocase subunit YajC
MIAFLALIAQTQTPQRAPSGAAFLFPALLMAMVVFMLLSSRSQKKRERRERDEMHARMAKNDRVLTIGGVVGTIVSVKDNEVVVKVDESTNTKMTFVKTAIQRIITEDQPLALEKR